MNLPIYIPPPDPEIPEADLIAKDLLMSLPTANAQMIEIHRSGFFKVWRNPRVTPDEILAALGTNGTRLLAAAQVSVTNLNAIAGITGHTIDDIMPREWWYPPREFIQHPDGTVTLAQPAEGFDAWGNPIPTPEPEPQTEPAENASPNP